VCRWRNTPRFPIGSPGWQLNSSDQFLTRQPNNGTDVLQNGTASTSNPGQRSHSYAQSALRIAFSL
jgi:hypothetical protein